MQNNNLLKNPVFLIVLAVAVIAVGYIILSPRPMPIANQTTTTAATGTPSTTPVFVNGQKPVTVTTKMINTANPTAPSNPLYFITPPTNDQWPIQTQNTIIWNRAGGISGQLDLVKANTQQFVGVILNQVGPMQTSYAWNTRDLLVSRTSPTKFTVAPGSYQIVLSYDGNHEPTAISPVFYVVTQ